MKHGVYWFRLQLLWPWQKLFMNLSIGICIGLLFTVEGRPIFIRTFGLVVSIIDSTLSRINTGDDILFVDLSLDPELFEGLKGDKQVRESSCSYQLWRFVPDRLKILSLCYSLQSDTYREMREVTEDCWEGRIELQKTKEICVH